MSFDSPPNKTVEEIGSQSILINTAEHEKMNFNLVFSVTADGSKLKPMGIFKRKISTVKSPITRCFYNAVST